MKMGKVIIDGIETEFSFGIDEEEIERNEEKIEDTIDLKEVLESINGKDTKN